MRTNCSSYLDRRKHHFEVSIPIFPSFILILLLPFSYTRTIKTHLKMLIYLTYAENFT